LANRQLRTVPLVPLTLQQATPAHQKPPPEQCPRRHVHHLRKLFQAGVLALGSVVYVQ